MLVTDIVFGLNGRELFSNFESKAEEDWALT